MSDDVLLDHSLGCDLGLMPEFDTINPKVF
jgi:hypothetical protein